MLHPLKALRFEKPRDGEAKIGVVEHDVAVNYDKVATAEPIEAKGSRYDMAEIGPLGLGPLVVLRLDDGRDVVARGTPGEFVDGFRPKQLAVVSAPGLEPGEREALTRRLAAAHAAAEDNIFVTSADLRVAVVETPRSDREFLVDGEGDDPGCECGGAGCDKCEDDEDDEDDEDGDFDCDCEADDCDCLERRDLAVQAAVAMEFLIHRPGAAEERGRAVAAAKAFLDFQAASEVRRREASEILRREAAELQGRYDAEAAEILASGQDPVEAVLRIDAENSDG